MAAQHYVHQQPDGHRNEADTLQQTKRAGELTHIKLISEGKGENEAYRYDPQCIKSTENCVW
ncbi:hypothetical protein GCM10007053_10150 [Halioglobus pacificus]|uniref:Uncharacterized protein n=1 Tax=Parahalioglobus pacificus TaxID=930806 RepID=A0A918XFC3_9GAMM|nr:hypothetical protein GCM10007053_10150 [Halioglobus pacificus]